MAPRACSRYMIRVDAGRYRWYRRLSTRSVLRHRSVPRLVPRLARQCVDLIAGVLETVQVDGLLLHDRVDDFHGPKRLDNRNHPKHQVEGELKHGDQIQNGERRKSLEGQERSGRCCFRCVFGHGSETTVARWRKKTFSFSPKIEQIRFRPFSLDTVARRKENGPGTVFFFA
jgi:hypothetical protein